MSSNGILIQSNDLKIDKSSLTGESDHMKKGESFDPMVLSGTHVMKGSDKILVSAIGVNFQAGIIFTLLSAALDQQEQKIKKLKKEAKKQQKKKSLSGDEDGEIGNSHAVSKQHSIDGKNHYGAKSGAEPESNKKEKSVLQAKLTKLAIKIGYAGLTIGILTIVILVIQFCVTTFYIENKKWKNTYANDLVRHLIIGVSVLVVAVPEGLPLAVTLSLAYSVKKALAPLAKGLLSVVEVLKKQLTISESTTRDLREEIRRLQNTVEQLTQENRELKNTIQAQAQLRAQPERIINGHIGEHDPELEPVLDIKNCSSPTKSSQRPASIYET